MDKIAGYIGKQRKNSDGKTDSFKFFSFAVYHSSFVFECVTLSFFFKMFVEVP